MRNQADSGVRQFDPNGAQSMHGVMHPGIEGPVGQEDEKQISGRIDPELGSGKASVPIGGVADQRAEETGLVEVLLWSVPPQQAGTAVWAAGQEPANSSGAHPLSLRAAARAQPARGITSQVQTSRENPGVACGPPEEGGVGVVALPLTRLPPPHRTR